MSTTQYVGRRGEETATAFLRLQGFDILGRNVRLGRKEIDVIAWDPHERTVVFVEVKTHARAHAYFSPEMNLRDAQKHTLLLAARAWLAEMDYEGFYRFDFIAVVGGVVQTHLKDYTRS